MATLSASSLDVNSIVSQLVSTERKPLDAQITRRQTANTTQISALGTLKNALSAFSSTLDTLTKNNAFSARTTSSSDTTIATATATGSSATGSYDVTVVALAQAHQLASNAFAGGSTATVGTGTLTISLGSTSFNVTIDSSNNTLAGIRDAINNASGNPGVRATLLNESGGSRLVLTSSETGASNTIKVAQSGGDGGLAQLVYDPNGTKNLTEVTAAQDSHIKIGTFDHYSSSNAVSDALDGVTINLLKQTDSGETVKITVSNDTSTLESKVTQFVNAYNSLHSTFAQLRTYNTSTKVAGPMLGDALLLGIENQVSSRLINPVSGVSGDYTTLASIGITRKADGSMQLDSTKLKAALSKNADSVANIFASTNGVAVKLKADIDEELKTDGIVDSRGKALDKEKTKIQDDSDAVDARMTKVESTYRAQFTALSTLISQLQSTSDYLTQQLANLPKASSG